MKAFFEVISYFPQRLKESLLIYKEVFKKVIEIRVRVNQRIVLILTDKSIVTDITVSEEEMDFLFKSICRFSMHSFEREINDGFITLNGSHRVGICGVKTQNVLSKVTSFNFRIARQIKEVSKEFFDEFFKGKIPSLLIFGKVLCGKTTFLRDLISNLSKNGIKVSVIDERGEFGNDLGLNTDVFTGYLKGEGMQVALRTMSPQVIVIDEIGTTEETNEILKSLNSGVKVIASAHADTFDNLKRREQINLLLEKRVFDYAVKIKDFCNVERVYEC